MLIQVSRLCRSTGSILRSRRKHKAWGVSPRIASLRNSKPAKRAPECQNPERQRRDQTFNLVGRAKLLIRSLPLSVLTPPLLHRFSCRSLRELHNYFPRRPGAYAPGFMLPPAFPTLRSHFKKSSDQGLGFVVCSSPCCVSRPGKVLSDSTGSVS